MTWTWCFLHTYDSDLFYHDYLNTTNHTESDIFHFWLGSLSYVLLILVVYRTCDLSIAHLECFATSLVAEMLTCVGKSDLSLHEILVSVKPFVSEWNRSRLQLLIHTQLYMGEARKFKLTLFILFNLNQLTNETVNAGFACNALLLCQLRNVFKNKGEKTRPEQQCEGSLHIYSVCLGDVSLKPFSVFELFFSCLVKVDLWFFVWKMNWLWKSEPIQVLLKKLAHSWCWYWCF